MNIISAEILALEFSKVLIGEGGRLIDRRLWLIDDVAPVLGATHQFVGRLGVQRFGAAEQQQLAQIVVGPLVGAAQVLVGQLNGGLWLGGRVG